MNQSTAGTRTGQSTETSLISSDRVEGTKVFDRAGKDIGTIKSVKIDKVSGRVAYAVAEFGGFLGMGGHEYTIPWRMLTYDTSKHGFVTDLTKEQLEGAPAGSRRDSYRASAGGVGTGKRPENEPGTSAMPDSDARRCRRQLGSGPRARAVRLLRRGLLLGRVNPADEEP